MKIKDIHKNLSSGIDLTDTSQKVDVFVVGGKELSFYDITEYDIALDAMAQEKIILDKRHTKNFDAISKSTFFKKDIPLKKKKIRIKNNIYTLSFYRLKNKIIGNWKGALVYLCLFSLAIFIYHDTLERYLNYSYETLSVLKDDFPDYNKVQADIAEAKGAFVITEYLFKPISYIPIQSIQDVDNMIQGGQKLTYALESVLGILFDLFVLLEEKEISEILFSHFLDNSHENFQQTLTYLGEANMSYKKIGRLGEDNIDNKIDTLKESLLLLIDKGGYISDNYRVLLGILGHEHRKKYMIVFQNSDEIRPQGGFMGSVGFVEIFAGEIVNFEKKDIYALEWEINKDPYRENAPEGINKITSSFGLRDANYFVGVGASSYKIQEFLKRGGITIDGIIYVNINIVSDLLDAIGGIDSKILETTVDSSNFSLLVSSIVEAKKAKQGTLGTPKEILFQFIDELSLQLKTDKEYKKYGAVLLKHIESRDLFIYSFDENEKEMLNYLGLDGSVDFNRSLDYNYPVFTSVSGNKSDRYIERSYIKKVDFGENCSINTTLQIELKHNFNLIKEAETLRVFDRYDIDIDRNIVIQGLGENKQFVRVVLPKTAVIHDKSIEIKEYGNTSVAEFYMNTARFESSYFDIAYTLPNLECRPYSYNFYKQPGVKDYNFEWTMGTEKLKFTGIYKDFKYKGE